MLKEFGVLPTDPTARQMKDRDYLWCLVHLLLDREEELERLCPDCRSRAAEDRCMSCGQPMHAWGEGAVNPAFDPERFESMKGGGGE